MSETKIDTPVSVLEEADKLVSNDRQKDYGHPFDDYTKVAKFASVIFGKEVTAEQCAMFMIGVKMSRQLNKHKRDNLVDMAGYVKVLEMIIERRYNPPPVFDPAQNLRAMRDARIG